MQNNIEQFQQLRKVFVLCPCCSQVYRLTDSHIFTDKLPNKDWQQKLQSEAKKLDDQEQKLKVKIEKLKLEAKERGRLDADNQIAKFDKVFLPLGLNPNDCKNICSPLDFIVFNGMHTFNVKNIIFLDKKGKEGDIQSSIREIIEHERYTFKTLRVDDDGNVEEE